VITASGRDGISVSQENPCLYRFMNHLSGVCVRLNGVCVRLNSCFTPAVGTASSLESVAGGF